MTAKEGTKMLDKFVTYNNKTPHNLSESVLRNCVHFPESLTLCTVFISNVSLQRSPYIKLNIVVTSLILYKRGQGFLLLY